MGFLLDILGSTIAGGLVILTLIQFNFTTTEMKNEFQSTYTIQSGINEVSEVIEFDFYKAGFRVPHLDVFITAKDTSVKYLADLFNDGSIDTVQYYLGLPSQASSTDNPNDRPLFRKLNSGSASSIGLVSEFNITYFDSTRTQISAATLNTTNGRRLIKSVSCDIIIESQWENNEAFQFVTTTTKTKNFGLCLLSGKKLFIQKI